MMYRAVALGAMHTTFDRPRMCFGPTIHCVRMSYPSAMFRIAYNAFDANHQVHGALGDEGSDGGYAQHPRRDHSEKDLPHGPPPPGHRFLRALQGGVADWNGDDGSSYAR